jgi:hypothetical protein
MFRTLHVDGYEGLHTVVNYQYNKHGDRDMFPRAWYKRMRDLATSAVKKFVRIRPEIMRKFAAYYKEHFDSTGSGDGGDSREAEGGTSKGAGRKKSGKLRRKKAKVAKQVQGGDGRKGKVLGVHIRGTDKNWGGEILRYGYTRKRMHLPSDVALHPSRIFVDTLLITCYTMRTLR